MNYYNDIWQEDMKQNGLIPLLKGTNDNEKDEEEGYVVVLNPFPEGSEATSRDKQVNVLEEVCIPKKKRESYKLFKALHDNYDWRHGKKDETPDGEWKEVNEFLEFAIDTEPMKIARNYAIEKGEIQPNPTKEEWINFLKSIWFRQYRGDSTSAFEHIFIGEQGWEVDEEDEPPEGTEYKLDGHHSWYHYYINDGPYEITEEEDAIFFLKHVEVQRSETSNKAEVITIRYIYTKKDENNSEKLYKDKGGFFVGLSTEGLLAMGTVAFLESKEQRKDKFKININNEEYTLVVAIKEGGVFRTFFPMLINPIVVK
ncbi:hypothetical protein M1D53_28970 (plasmid) [Bacillus sp. PK9-021]